MKRIAYLSMVLLPMLLSGQSIRQDLDSFLTSTPKPASASEFDQLPHLSPRNQDTTLICWSFATSSFIESELARLGKTPVRLSVVYPVYCVFQEKAKRYIATRGASRFSPGDLFTGVLDMYREYGAMPAAAYELSRHPAITYNHNSLYAELEQLMKRVKEQRLWDESRVLTQVESILDKHLGKPPVTFAYEGKQYTPQSFMQSVISLPWNDYLLVTSFQYAPYNSWIELKVPDNWKHQTVYYNVPLDTFYHAMTASVRRGYSVAFDADISEPSYELSKRYAIIPPFDLALNAVTPEAREFRFNNGSTTDDHLMHIVGVRTFGTHEWFLVKDSWGTAYAEGGNGYMFFHESYMKLKALAFLVHKDALSGMIEVPTQP